MDGEALAHRIGAGNVAAAGGTYLARPAVKRRSKRGPARAAARNKGVGSTSQSALAAARTLQAATRTGDATAAAKLLARDFAFIDAAGKVHARRDVLQSLKASPRGAGAQVKRRDYGRIA